MNKIIVLCLDSLRYDYVTPETTPNLLRIAEEGIFYENCLSGGTATLESMPVILCGLREYDPALSIMARLRRRGYFSVLVHSNPLVGRNFSKGWDDVIDIKERDWGQRRVRLRRLLRKWVPHSFLTLIRGFYRWLQREEGYLPYLRADEMLSATTRIIEVFNDKPLFVWVHLMDPHIPYYPQDRSHQGCPKTHEELADLNDKLVDAVHERYKPTTEEVEIYKLLYSLEISEMDKAIGRFYNSQDHYDMLLIITSDHGDEFGEEGQFSHHSNKFISVLQHVPLIVVGVGKGRVKTHFSHFNFSTLIMEAVSSKTTTNVEKKGISNLL